MDPGRTPSDSEDYAIKDGLEDWLEALGPLVIPEAVAGRRCRKPWSRWAVIGQLSSVLASDWSRHPSAGEDIASLNIKENMDRISRN